MLVRTKYIITNIYNLISLKSIAHPKNRWQLITAVSALKADNNDDIDIDVDLYNIYYTYTNKWLWCLCVQPTAPHSSLSYFDTATASKICMYCIYYYVNTIFFHQPYVVY